jgi:UDP-N-acetylglucosamine acyltransferase
MASTFIHPMALVEKGAELDEGVYVGPFSTIAATAKIGARTRLESHIVIDANVSMGVDNVVYPFSMIGAPPQDLSYKGDDTRVEIGDHNVFRESTTIHRGTVRDKSVTRVGSHNYIMAFCHIAHDCQIGSNIIMANQTALAGHVQIFDYANIGGQSAICQKVRIGERSFVGAGSVVRKDLPPFMAAKEFAQVTGPNLIGLKRQSLGEENIRVICEMYKILYLSNSRTEKALADIRERFVDNPYAERFVKFLESTEIGIQR